MPIRVEIVSQDRMVWEGDADMVVVPGSDGEMGILPNHAPLLSTLRYGVLKVRREGQEEVFAIAGGVVEVQPDIVTVLADAAENVREIDIERAEAARRRAEDVLRRPSQVDPNTVLAIEASLKRSNLRLNLARRYRGMQTGRTSGGGAKDNE